MRGDDERANNPAANATRRITKFSLNGRADSTAARHGRGNGARSWIQYAKRSLDKLHGPSDLFGWHRNPATPLADVFCAVTPPGATHECRENHRDPGLVDHELRRCDQSWHRPRRQ